MPRLKQLPTNAYETLCAELAGATAQPFGEWCALNGSRAVGYGSYMDFEQAARDCLKEARARAEAGCSKADLAILADLVAYLSARAERAQTNPREVTWLVDTTDPDCTIKALHDPHAIGLLFLDHGPEGAQPGGQNNRHPGIQDNAQFGADVQPCAQGNAQFGANGQPGAQGGTALNAEALQGRVSELLTQYAILKAEGRRLAEDGVPESISGFTPIEKNRSFASTGAKIGQLMGYPDYSEKAAELPLPSPTQEIPTAPKQEGNTNARYFLSLAKSHLFRAIESDLYVVRPTGTLSNSDERTPVAWRWGFAQGNRTDERGRLGLIGCDHAKWLAAGHVLAEWFTQSCKNADTVSDLAREALGIAHRVGEQCARDGSPKAAEMLASYAGALARRWDSAQGSDTRGQIPRVVGELLTPLFAATLCCVARRSPIQCGFDAALVEVGLDTVPASDEGEHKAAEPRREYVTLHVSRVPTAERGSGRERDVESHKYELGTLVRIGRAPSYADQPTGNTQAAGPHSQAAGPARDTNMPGDNLASGSSTQATDPAPIEHATRSANSYQEPVEDLILGDPAVSRLALVLRTEDALELEVLNENTYLRGQRQQKGATLVLAPGDALTVLGKSVDYVIEIAQLG